MDFPYFFKLKTPIEYDGEQIEQFVFDELEQSALTNIRTFVERSDYPPSASQKRNALEYLISQMIDEPEQIFKFVSDEDFKRIIHFLFVSTCFPHSYQTHFMLVQHRNSESAKFVIRRFKATDGKHFPRFEPVVKRYLVTKVWFHFLQKIFWNVLIARPEPHRGVLLYLLNPIELITAQPFDARGSIVSFNVSVLLGYVDLQRPYSGVFCPALKPSSDIFRAIVNPSGQRFTPLRDDLVQRPHDTLGRQ